MQTPPEPSPSRLLDALSGIDLTSADGRAGIGRLLAEIERLCPGAITRQAATHQLRSLGCPAAPDPR